jgi:hypothetical protein
MGYYAFSMTDFSLDDLSWRISSIKRLPRRRHEADITASGRQFEI